MQILSLRDVDDLGEGLVLAVQIHTARALKFPNKGLFVALLQISAVKGDALLELVDGALLRVGQSEKVLCHCGVENKVPMPLHWLLKIYEHGSSDNRQRFSSH